MLQNTTLLNLKTMPQGSSIIGVAHSVRHSDEQPMDLIHASKGSNIIVVIDSSDSLVDKLLVPIPCRDKYGL